MEIDKDKIDNAVLALRHLTLDRDGHAWKEFDWDALNLLHAKGFICDPAIRRSGDPAIRRSGDPAIRRSGDPASKAKSVWLTEEGIARSEQLFRLGGSEHQMALAREPRGDGKCQSARAASRWIRDHRQAGHRRAVVKPGPHQTV